MYDYIIKITKEKKIICALGLANADSDNYLYDQLDELVRIVKRGFENKEQLLSDVYKTTNFEEVKEFDCSNDVLDLDNHTIRKPFFPLYEINEVTPEECCISLRVNGKDYYSIYEDGSEYLMEHVAFDDVDLLRKEIVTLDEFLKISNFVKEITKDGETDFVLNDKLIIRFNIL